MQVFKQKKPTKKKLIFIAGSPKQITKHYYHSHATQFKTSREKL